MSCTVSVARVGSCNGDVVMGDVVMVMVVMVMVVMVMMQRTCALKGCRSEAGGATRRFSGFLPRSLPAMVPIRCPMPPFPFSTSAVIGTFTTKPPFVYQ